MAMIAKHKVESFQQVADINSSSSVSNCYRFSFDSMGYVHLDGSSKRGSQNAKGHGCI